MSVLLVLLLVAGTAIAGRVDGGSCGKTTYMKDESLYTYDISSLSKPMTQFYQAMDVYQQQYFFNFCDPVYPAVMGCDPSSAVCQQTAAGAKVNCGVVSTRTTTPLSITQWIHGEAVTPLDGVTMTFTNGAPYSSGARRSSFIHVLCDKVHAPTIIGVVEVPSIGYNIYMTAPAACPTKAAFKSAVLVADPTMGVIWQLEWNGTASWTPLVQNIKAPGQLTLNFNDQTLYWTANPPEAVNGIFSFNMRRPAAGVSVYDTSKLPNSAPLHGIAAGSDILAIQYGGDRLAVLSLPNMTLQMNYQESTWFVPARCSVFDAHKVASLRAASSGYPAGHPQVVDVDTRTSTLIPTPSALISNIDFKPPHHMLLVDQSAVVYYGEPMRMGTPAFTMATQPIVRAPVKDATLDQYGQIYLVDATNSLFVVHRQTRSIEKIPIPSWMTIGSIEGI